MEEFWLFWGTLPVMALQAAVAMNRARRALLLSSIVTADPGAILARANVELVREATPIITAVVATIDPVNRLVHLCSCGTSTPITCRDYRRFAMVRVRIVAARVYRPGFI